VFFPDATLKGVWDLLCLIFIIYQSIVIPFRLCFEVDAEGSVQVFETIIDIAFMLDISTSSSLFIYLVISFNTGFYKKGYLVMKRKEIIKNYLQTWFVMDLLASFPYSMVFKPPTQEDIDDDDDDDGGALYRTP